MTRTEGERGFLRRAYAWPRVRVVLIASAVLGTLMLGGWTGSVPLLYFRIACVGAVLLFVFAVLERGPRRLPRFVARWALQIVGVAVAVPPTTGLIYSLTTLGDPVPWVRNESRMSGFGMIAGMGVLIAPWIAMVAVYREISGQARRQALEFELERTQLARQALQARVSLLQSQVEPHFLFNTLANVRELVAQGSPRAPAMLQSLIDYLRAAVPRLHQPTSTIAEELELVRAYLEIMQMRMPDRLQYSVHADPAALDARCPPAGVLVLVENAVRHGIDPSETGGTVIVNVRREPGACVAEVLDTGVGLRPSSGGLGTGLQNLRERLTLGFGPGAALELSPNTPRGARALLRIPTAQAHAA
jgi:two-component sensor histidine kinase